MKRKYFSALLMGALTIASVSTFTSCKDYDDDISSLQSQIDQLKKTIDEINSQITAGSILTDVTKNDNGITVKLSNGKTYDITNGKDGKAGSVVKIVDGVWYIDDVSTGLNAKGDKGDKGDPGTPGTNGTGTPGAAGKDGAYYLPKEDGYFYKVDGNTETKTGIMWKTASNDAITAVMGEEDLKLGHVLKSDGTYGEYTISLSSNLRGFVFQKDNDSRAYVDGVPAIRISSFSYNDLSAGATKDSEKEIWTGAKEATVINPETYAYYHVIPANASEAQLKNLMFALEANGDYIQSRAAASKDFAAKPEFVEFKDGILKVKVNVTGTPATDEKITTVALQANRKNGEVVTSDYTTIYKNDMDPLFLADTVKINKKENYHFRRGTVGISNKDTEAGTKVKGYEVWSKDAQKKAEVDTVVAYNGKLDLSTFVGVHQKSKTGCTVVKDLSPLGMSIKYDVVKNYILGEKTKTDQKDFISVSEDGIVTPKVFSTSGEAAIDRTPIVRVSLMNGSKVVEVAYVKIKIVRPEEIIPAKDPIPLTVDNFKFVCDKSGTSKTTVEQINVQLYNKLGMSKKEFHSAYPYFTDYNHVKSDVGTVAEIKETDAEGGKTYLYEWTISNDDLWKHAGEEVSNEIVFKNAETKATDSVVVVLKSKIDGVKKTYNVWTKKADADAVKEKAHYYLDYWNNTDNPTYAKLNVQTPNTGDKESKNCKFVCDLNAPFYNVDGQLYLGENITNLQYFFCADKDGVATIKDIDDAKVTFSVENDGLELWASATVGKTTYAKQLIATINNAKSTGVYDVERKNSIELNKDGVLAKYLLNTKKLYTYIGAKANVCKNKDKEVAITFGGKNHFQANFVRPIDIATNANDNFIDGVDLGEKGSYITIEDLISPSDWRLDAKTGAHRLFSDYPTYWDFYGPFEVEALIKQAQCDLNGELQAVPATIVLDQVATISGVTTTTKFGYITYRNNGAGVQNAFNVYIPVKVKYGWGEIVTDPIKVNVATTIQANARKK